MNTIITDHEQETVRSVNTATYAEPVGQSLSDVESYRTMSKAALMSLVIGVLSLSAFVFPIFVGIAPLAILFGFLGYRAAKKYPHEFTGVSVAMGGIALGCVSFFGAIGYHSYVYATEVREGYQRMTFGEDLKTDSEERPISEKAIAMNGQKVFLKGYVRSGLKSSGMKEFLMVGDFGECCFGKSPSISDIVLVKMPEGKTANFDYMLRRVHGTFKVNRRLQSGTLLANDVSGYVYELEADSYE